MRVPDQQHILDPITDVVVFEPLADLLRRSVRRLTRQATVLALRHHQHMVPPFFFVDHEIVQQTAPRNDGIGGDDRVIVRGAGTAFCLQGITPVPRRGCVEIIQQLRRNLIHNTVLQKSSISGR